MKRGQGCDDVEVPTERKEQHNTTSKIRLTSVSHHTHKETLPSAIDYSASGDRSEGPSSMLGGLHGCRVVTRSRSKDAASTDSQMPCASAAVPAMLPLIADHHAAAANAYASNQDLKSRTSAQHQAGHTALSVSSYSSSLPAAIKLAAGSSNSTCRSPTRPGRSLQQQPQQPQRQASNDLQNLVDAGSKFTHPSLLRHGGGKQQQQQPTTIRASIHALSDADAPAYSLPATSGKLHSSHATAASSHRACSPQIAARSSRHTSPLRPALAAGSPSRARCQEDKRVQFAPGPLLSRGAKVKGPITEDGHPATEGALAVPVRRVQPSYALDLTKGNVLLLEQLLGADCVMSVTRLKRRVGLLPPIRAPRPHVSSRPASNGMHNSSNCYCYDDEAEREAEIAFAAAAPADARNQQQKGAYSGSCAPVPGKARAVAVGSSSSGRTTRH